MDKYQKYFEEATGGESRPGNSLKLLQNGGEIFPAMLEAVRGAQSTIEFTTYVYWRSKIATEFANALCERARAGVKVRLLVDAVGGAIMSTRTVGQLERAGVQVAWFRPLRVGHLRRFNNRTHRKILLIDGQVGFTGGVGIADEWDGAAESAKHWRETHCQISGPACLDLFAGFASNWAESTGEQLAPPATAPAPAGPLSILTTTSTPGSRPNPMERLFTAVTTAASERLWITTAYFVPNPALVAALCAAARRGVDVRIITNGSSTNHKITRHAGQATYEALLEAGVKVYEYQRTTLHVKLITVDRAWATLGSTNFDNRSLVHNDELNISFVSSEIIASLDKQFENDLESSEHIRAAVWKRRPWHQRLIIAGSRVFSDQL